MIRVRRTSGILLHPTSLPGRFGIGDTGEGARRFVDFLVESGQTLWQVLPLGPTGYGDSPYACFSAFAGNPLLVSPQTLQDEGFLRSEDLAGTPDLPSDRVDYDRVIHFKTALLRKSFERFERVASSEQKEAFNRFCWEEASWLDDFALFMSLKTHSGGLAWNAWDRDVATRQPEAIQRWMGVLAEPIQFHKYVQHQFFRQWSDLKRYANERNVGIIGDAPIFVAYDSSDAWANPDLFHFDEEGSPTVVAGVPPDYFSETGQLWGNPIYRWDVMKRRGYDWWIRRLRTLLRTVDWIRLDHFRGFEAYWAVPAGSPTAVKGTWMKGPGADLFDSLRTSLGELPIIAEDLGLITPQVEALRERFGFPGMKVFQFAFGTNAANPFLPHNFERNYVVYPGTHDNDTVLGWFEGLPQDKRDSVLRYLGTDGSSICWDFVRWAFASVARMAVIQLQDLLCLGSEARMNYPGRLGGNWIWRYTAHMLTDEIGRRLKELSAIYGRGITVDEDDGAVTETE